MMIFRLINVARYIRPMYTMPKKYINTIKKRAENYELCRQVFGLPKRLVYINRVRKFIDYNDDACTFDEYAFEGYQGSFPAGLKDIKYYANHREEE